MIKNPSYSGRARIAENPNSGMTSTRNPNSVDSVNQRQGPRTGNMAARPGKRQDFVEDKQSRAPLADVINQAYAQRGRGRQDHVNPALEGIHSDTNVKFKR
jgi:hypothetical protein